MNRLLKQTDVLALIDHKIESLQEDFEMFGKNFGITERIDTLRNLRKQVPFITAVEEIED